jgi:D-aminoacyl-tRNA deacylase
MMMILLVEPSCHGSTLPMNTEEIQAFKGESFKSWWLLSMMNLILASTQDLAGMNIAHHVLELFDFERIGESQYTYQNSLLVFIEKDSVYAESPENPFENVDFVVFASRHSSEAGVPSLTVHTPGNFGAADFGGTPGEICFSNPIAQKLGLQELKTQRDALNLEFEVSMEATHHGPLTETPTMFIEIGSEPDQWVDKKAGEAVAVALMKALTYPDYNFPKAVGIGGGHYCQKHTLIALYREYAIGHVLAKYVPVTEENVRKALEKNGGCDAFILDWKGTPDRSSVAKMLEKFNKPVIKAKKLLK